MLNNKLDFEKFLHLIMVGLIITIVIIRMKLNWAFTTDDMYITLTYAKNWVETGALIWNIPEPLVVEGYSNFSYLVMACALLKAQIDPVLFFKLLGNGSLLLSLYYQIKLSRLYLHGFYCYIPTIIFINTTGAIWWATSGLETPFFTLLFLLSFLFFLQGCGYTNLNKPPLIISPPVLNKNKLFLSSILLFLCAITRQEGVGVFIILCLNMLFTHRGSFKKNLLSNTLYFILPFVFLYGLYFISKTLYFGSVFSNSVLCKKNFLGSDVLLNNFLYWGFLYFALALLTLRKWGDIKYSSIVLLVIMYCVGLYGSDPIIGYFNRHFLPIMSLMLILSAAGVANIIEFFLTLYGFKLRLTSIVQFALLALIFLYYFIEGFNTFGLQAESNLYNLRMKTRMSVAKWINHNTNKNDRILLGDVGLISYKTHSNIIDLYCLNNKDLSTTYSKKQYNYADFIMKKAPEIIIISSVEPTILVSRTLIEKKIITHNNFKHYRKKIILGNQFDNTYYWIFKKMPTLLTAA